MRIGNSPDLRIDTLTKRVEKLEEDNFMLKVRVSELEEYVRDTNEGWWKYLLWYHNFIEEQDR